LTPPSSHVCAPQCAGKKQQVMKLKGEAMRLQRRTTEAEQKLEEATSCHQVQVAELTSMCSSLLGTTSGPPSGFLGLRLLYNDMLQRLEDTQVRVQQACCKPLRLPLPSSANDFCSIAGADATAA
jgi:hypothetical protein